MASSAAGLSCTASHQQLGSGAPQAKVSPQALHFFCVGADSLRCVPSPPRESQSFCAGAHVGLGASELLAVARSPLGVMGMRLGKVAFEDFNDLLFGHGANDLVGHLPALENQKGGDAADIEFSGGIDVLVHVELDDFELADILTRDFFDGRR